MKTTSNNNNILVQLNQNEMNQLTTQVTETVASGNEQHSNKSTFSAADLWKIQRGGRTAISRRRMFA